jgi:hypothetical protein
MVFTPPISVSPLSGRAGERPFSFFTRVGETLSKNMEIPLVGFREKHYICIRKINKHLNE